MKRAFLIIFGIAIGLLLVESGMRSAGLWLSARPPVPGTSSTEKDVIRILCLGESTTAPTPYYDHSWPAQLQRILQRRGSRRYRVINRGGIASNTEILANRFPQDIYACRPHIVIAMIGVNDHGWHGIQARAPLSARLRSWRVFKLARSARQALAAAFFRPRPLADKMPSHFAELGARYLGRGMKEEARIMYERALAEDPSAIEWASDLAYLYRLEGRWAQAEAVLLKATQLGNTALYAKLAELYETQGRFDAAEAAYRRAIRLHPENENFRHGLEALAASRSRAAHGKPVVEKRSLLDIAGGPTTVNYRKIVRMAQAGGALFFAMQYPLRDAAELRRMLEGLPDVIFIDNKDSFRKALNGGSYDDYFIDRFGGNWGHCTERGNRLIAQNAAKAVLEALK